MGQSSASILNINLRWNFGKSSKYQIYTDMYECCEVLVTSLVWVVFQKNFLRKTDVQPLFKGRLHPFNLMVRPRPEQSVERYGNRPEKRYNGCGSSCGRCFEMKASKNLRVCFFSEPFLVLFLGGLCIVSSCLIMFDCSWFIEGCREVGLDTFPFSGREWRQCRDRMLEAGPDSWEKPVLGMSQEVRING